jgi:hypothetical protein
MIDKNLNLSDLEFLLQLKPTTSIQDFKRNLTMYGVKPEDAKALCARQDIFPKSQPLKVSVIEAKI